MGLGTLKPAYRGLAHGAGSGADTTAAAASVGRPLARPSRQRLGLALFHNDADPTNGIALMRGDNLRAFESRTALPSHSIWISTANNGAVAHNFRPKH